MPERKSAAPGMGGDGDEISLFDLWNVLVRRWVVVAGVFAAAVLVAAAIALTRPDVYRVTQLIELAAVPDADAGTGASFVLPTARRPIVPQGDAVLALRDVVVPETLDQWASEGASGRNSGQGDGTWRPELSVDAVQGGDFVRLSARVPEARVADTQEIMTRVVEALAARHAEAVARVRSDLEARVDQARAQAGTTRQRIAAVERRLEHLDELERLTKAQIEEMEALTPSLPGPDTSGAIAGDAAANAVMAYLVPREKAQIRARIHELETALISTIPERRIDAHERRAELETQLREEERGLSALEQRLAFVVPTRAPAEPRREPGPLQTSAGVVIALGAILGLMGGLLGAFLAEFVARARRAGA